MAGTHHIVEALSDSRGGSVIVPIVNQEGVGRGSNIVKGDVVRKETGNVPGHILEPEVDLFGSLPRAQLKDHRSAVRLPT